MRYIIIKSIIFKFLSIAISIAFASSLVSFAAGKSIRNPQENVYKMIFDNEIIVYLISLLLCLTVLEVVEKKYLQRKFNLY